MVLARLNSSLLGGDLPPAIAQDPTFTFTPTTTSPAVETSVHTLDVTRLGVFTDEVAAAHAEHVALHAMKMFVMGPEECDECHAYAPTAIDLLRCVPGVDWIADLSDMAQSAWRHNWGALSFAAVMAAIVPGRAPNVLTQRLGHKTLAAMQRLRQFSFERFTIHTGSRISRVVLQKHSRDLLRSVFRASEDLLGRIAMDGPLYRQASAILWSPESDAALRYAEDWLARETGTVMRAQERQVMREVMTYRMAHELEKHVLTSEEAQKRALSVVRSTLDEPGFMREFFRTTGQTGSIRKDVAERLSKIGGDRHGAEIRWTQEFHENWRVMLHRIPAATLASARDAVMGATEILRTARANVPAERWSEYIEEVIQRAARTSSMIGNQIAEGHIDGPKTVDVAKTMADLIPSAFQEASEKLFGAPLRKI